LILECATPVEKSILLPITSSVWRMTIAELREPTYGPLAPTHHADEGMADGSPEYL
jgi:hypothetical protein